jgi:2-polyprenyl-6-methoxyphenol hydroxylase-like FAD-dependent oxidoreductase
VSESASALGTRVKILISGAGIAGPCLAYWLHEYGLEATIIERASSLRSGGYIVDFWGAGFDVAERMNLVPKLLQKGYKIKELRQVNRDGRRTSGFAVEIFDKLTGGRFTSIPRSELAASIYGALDGKVETIFEDSITRIEESALGVQVEFQRSPARRFDLVVGADGLHSQVRRLAFGEDALFERYVGLKVAAFTVTGYRPRDELAYVVHTELGQQVGRFSMRDDRTMFLFVFADEDPRIPDEIELQKALLRHRYHRSGWECPGILAALDGTDSVYLDRVSQIKMEQWSRGRIALIGDAAFCVSLLAGQGSALAMVAAYVLAGELKRVPDDHAAAFARYQKRLAGLIATKQKAAVRFAGFFAPSSRLGIFMRNQVMKLMAIPLVAELAVGREIQDRIELPKY